MATVKDLSVCFIQNLMNITAGYDEIILVFDTYKVDSLKKATRQERPGIQDPVQYQKRDETIIKHISMSKFLSHDQTESDLTEYLAEKSLHYNQDSNKLVIVSTSGTTRSNKLFNMY